LFVVYKKIFVVVLFKSIEWCTYTRRNGLYFKRISILWR